MTEQEPTQEELFKFWEWCGLVYYSDDTWWYTGDGRFAHDGKLTLDNLFKSPVPKLTESGYHVATNTYSGKVGDKVGHCSWAIITKDDKPVSMWTNLKLKLALFRAIQEAIK